MKKLLVFTKYQRPHLFVQYSRGKTSFRAARIMLFFGGSACKGRSFVHFLVHCLVFVSFRLCFVKLRDVIRTSIIIALPHTLHARFRLTRHTLGVGLVGWGGLRHFCLALAHLPDVTSYTFLLATS